MERNSDVVKMSSFAPLLEHFDMAEWSVSEIRIMTHFPTPLKMILFVGKILTFI